MITWEEVSTDILSLPIGWCPISKKCCKFPLSSLLTMTIILIIIIIFFIFCLLIYVFLVMTKHSWRQLTWMPSY